MEKAQRATKGRSDIQETDKEIMEVRNFMKQLTKINWGRNLIAFAAAVAVFYFAALSSYAAEGKVIADTAKIREQANTESTVVGSTVKGKTIDILGAVKDSSGTVWYKVSVTGGGFGYIRSDLVQTSETITVTETAPAATTETTTDTPAASLPDTVPTSIGEQQAQVKSDSNVRIRSGASTSYDTVASLPNGTSITLIGEANDSAGNKWYQMTCNYNNKTIEGYIRSDLLTIGSQEGASDQEQPAEGGEQPADSQENPEGENPEGDQPAEEPQEEPQQEEHNDYEIVYAQNSDSGEYEYYLYDNINGNRQKLAELLNVVNVANENNARLQAQIEKEKIIIIILAVVVVLMVIVITLLLLKIRSLSYEDYDEEDYEEEEPIEEPEPERKKKKRAVREEAEQEPAPVRRKRSQAVSEREQEEPVRKQKREPEISAAERKEPARKPSRKPQNFLTDDDEFEFEFLNMDDKDL